mmetsp:Transcript_78021/g.210990  ORF Transcript_78021/g.210990 Transcript_78021/m.210990 type:complete len:282 (-) Transcript_78021:311-1156(-)
MHSARGRERCRRCGRRRPRPVSSWKRLPPSRLASPVETSPRDAALQAQGACLRWGLLQWPRRRLQLQRRLRRGTPPAVAATPQRARRATDTRCQGRRQRPLLRHGAGAVATSPSPWAAPPQSPASLLQGGRTAAPTGWWRHWSPTPRRRPRFRLGRCRCRWRQCQLRRPARCRWRLSRQRRQSAWCPWKRCVRRTTRRRRRGGTALCCPRVFRTAGAVAARASATCACLWRTRPGLRCRRSTAASVSGARGLSAVQAPRVVRSLCRPRGLSIWRRLSAPFR